METGKAVNNFNPQCGITEYRNTFGDDSLYPCLSSSGENIEQKEKHISPLGEVRFILMYYSMKRDNSLCKELPLVAAAGR